MRYGGIYALLILIATWMAMPALVFTDEAAEERWEHKLCELGDLKERLANPPPRDPKIEQPDEPYKMSLKNVGPQWIEQKYIAVVRLELPKRGEVATYELTRTGFRPSAKEVMPRPSEILQEDQELSELQLLSGGVPLIAPNYRPKSDESRTKKFTRFVTNTPPDRRPDQAEIDYFVGETPFYWNPHPTKQNIQEFHIPATTAELAERRARAFLTLLDQGFSRTLQLALYEKLDMACQHLQESQAKLDELTAEEKQVAKKLEQYAGFHAGMLDQLRLQKLQLEIDMAGVKARIAGCNKVLKEVEGNAERWNQIQELKTAAEIELLVIEARQAKAAEFLTKVKEAGELAAKQEQAQKKLKEATLNYYQAANQISRIHEEIRWFAPLPLVDNKIIVQELEWTQ